MFERRVLKNGARALFIPSPSSKACTVLVLVGTGSKYETKKLNGISHFLEHLFFKGTTKRPSKQAVAEYLDRVGGMYNAFTSQEYTGYYAKVSSPSFEKGVDWVSDILLHSTFPAKEIERERGVVIEEINMYYDNPSDYVGILWQELLYGDQPAGWDIAGTKENLRTISREDILAYHKRQYTASNTVVVISGNVDSASAFEMAQDYFRELPPGKPSARPKVVDTHVDSFRRIRSARPQSSPQVLLHERATDQANFCFGVRAFPLSDRRRYAQKVAGSILGGMMSSRLFLEVREKLGLAYYVKTHVDANPDTGYLVTQAGTDAGKAEKAISVILREYRKMASRSISPRELKKAKEYLKGKMALSLETSDAIASFYGLQEISERKILEPKEIFDRIDRVTSSQVRQVCRSMFQKKNLNLSIVGPFKEKKRFEKLLNS